MGLAPASRGIISLLVSGSREDRGSSARLKCLFFAPQALLNFWQDILSSQATHDSMNDPPYLELKRCSVECFGQWSVGHGKQA